MMTLQDRPGAEPGPGTAQYADPAEIEDQEASASEQQDAVGGASRIVVKLDGTRDY
jgi:hypothetical protein